MRLLEIPKGEPHGFIRALRNDENVEKLGEFTNASAKMFKLNENSSGPVQLKIARDFPPLPAFR